MSSIPVVSGPDVDLAYAAAQRVVETHRRVSAFLRVGQTLGQVDRFIAEQLADQNCKSCFIGYRPGGVPPFPSHACLSVNECIVHGTAIYLDRPLQEGDLLKIDIGVKFRGWIGDAAWTYSFGEPADDVRRLMEAGKDSLRRGIEKLRPENTYLAWAEEVQSCVEREHGFHLVRGLGGHGYGRSLHAPPFVSNVVPSRPGEWPDAKRKCAPGTLVAVEPMLAIGTGRTRHAPRDWPIFTGDGSMAVHYEHDVLITDAEPRVLSEGMDDLPDVVG
ncbi:MAG: M24 family metallopeptidase [Planctomycetota bacterium]